MGLFGALNTAVSGMAAQANKLGTIGDNIANSSTTGYKRASTEFETLLGNTGTSDYSSGGVITNVRYGISDQGTITSTTSATDLAIKGDGFFVGEDSSGAQVLTRAGSFTKQTDGTLQNTAGYTLMGYATGSTTLTTINVGSTALVASASTAATLSVNLNSSASVVAAANLPSANATSSTYTSMTQLTAYDNLGTPVTLDVYMSKADTTGDWSVSVFNHADAATTGTGNFQYSSAALTTQTLAFNPATGVYSSGSPISLSVPNGNTISIDMSKSTQLDSAFVTNAKNIDGSAPASLSSITIGPDGTVNQVYSNGTTKSAFQVALANVASPDLLTTVSGDAYTVNKASGSMIVSTPGSNGTGLIESSSLEGSTVDLATELTDMIAAQRGYEANSKVLQTASDLLGTLNNIHTS
ncbi:flagellar hook protein FlgE [Lichenifustis flavocetrariae]|uniref:Flagellar hook protein FlgE n=1 Tax=Lichenifustis flavocetrariae TaxID=2949735 RepID=A0AA41YWI1_9HYPH|nr:flagellar hook protein FlgE [Lichenifustis flavocetrariae]MCW6508531.1 flagellar hook protein FlgE [Lichenifustis flavocetrariae]